MFTESVVKEDPSITAARLVTTISGRRKQLAEIETQLDYLTTVQTEATIELSGAMRGLEDLVHSL